MNVIINPEYNFLASFIHNIPVSFDKGGETIYDGRNEIKIFTVDNKKIVIKSFKVPYYFNRIAYSFFRASKAKRSYDYSWEIIRRGFHSPTPIAYIEGFKSGLLKHSYYISDYSDHISLKEFKFIHSVTKENTEIFKAFARLTAHLHDAEIYHTDYSNGNIMYKREENDIRFDLVDVNRVQFKKVTEDMGYKAFHRLDLSIEMLEIIAKEYAEQRQFDVAKSIDKVVKYNLKSMKPYESFNIPKPV
jgi:serine/threonine protein kinase